MDLFECLLRLPSIHNSDCLAYETLRFCTPLSLPENPSEPEFEQLHELILNWGQN